MFTVKSDLCGVLQIINQGAGSVILFLINSLELSQTKMCRLFIVLMHYFYLICFNTGIVEVVKLIAGGSHK